MQLREAGWYINRVNNGGARQPVGRVRESRRKNLIPAKRIESDVRAFCRAIQTKIRQSPLGPELQKELAGDLSDFVSRISVNGKNGKSQSTRRGR
jgi:hypothetical protein